MGEVGVGVTPCEHRFHLPCWDAFSSSTLGQRPPLCPNCRKVVNSDLEAVEIDIEEEDGERFDLPRAPSSSDSLDSVDTENQRSTDVYYDSGRESSDSFSTFTNDNIPDLSSLEISVGRKQDQLNQLIENLHLQSRDCGWIAGGQRNQCFTLAIAASFFHGRSGSINNRNGIEQAAVKFDSAITMAVPIHLCDKFFRRGENEAIDSDVLEYIVSCRESQFSEFELRIEKRQYTRG